jgi:Pyridoxamine 5'-phosphate oxidase
VTVPPEIVAALAGSPEVGSWEPMFPLLTVDEPGFPHVCLLSRAELHSDVDYVYAALASPTTVNNLSRRPAATLMVITDDSACYLKLRVVHTTGSGLTGVVFEVISSVRDSLAIPLTPPRYLVTSSLPVAEAWAQSAELLSSLTGQIGTDPAT